MSNKRNHSVNLHVMTHVQLMSSLVRLLITYSTPSGAKGWQLSLTGGLAWGTSFDGACRHYFFFFFFEPAVPSRKPAARSSKSIATQCGQMTTRLVWRPTSFHNMWPGLLNRRQGLREKIFPCTKSDLAAGGPWSCEWAASTPAKDCGAKRKHSIFLHPGDSPAPPTGSIYQWYLAGGDVSSIMIAASSE